MHVDVGGAPRNGTAIAAIVVDEREVTTVDAVEVSFVPERATVA